MNAGWSSTDAPAVLLDGRGTGAGAPSASLQDNILAENYGDGVASRGVGGTDGVALRDNAVYAGRGTAYSIQSDVGTLLGETCHLNGTA